MPLIVILIFCFILGGLAQADPASDGKPDTRPGGNQNVSWDISAEQSQTNPARWYVYAVIFTNRSPDNERLGTVLSSDFTYFYVLESQQDVTDFNAMLTASAAHGWITFPESDPVKPVFRLCTGRLLYSEGKVSLESEDYCINTPLATYDRWAAQAKVQHLTGVRKRIPGDLTVSFDIDSKGDMGLLFDRIRLDSEGVEKLRNCAKAIEVVAEERLLPHVRYLAAEAKKAQQATVENQQKANLLK